MSPVHRLIFFCSKYVSFVWTSLFQINRRKRLCLALNIVTVIKLTISISNFQIIYTVGGKKISKINISSYKLRPWFTKGDAPPSKTCKFDLINGEAHSNVSGFSDRTLAECYKSILSNFQNDTEPTMWGTIFHQADLSGGVRRIDLGKSTPAVQSFFFKVPQILHNVGGLCRQFFPDAPLGQTIYFSIFLMQAIFFPITISPGEKIMVRP